MDPKIKSVSKSMSYVLRHKPDAIGITLDPNGWVDVDDLLAAFQRDGKRYTRRCIDRAVAENDKQRFEFSEDGTRIRARQGHSINVDLGYEPAAPPDVLFHGTATRNLDSIRKKGLLKMNRHHVHLSTSKETMLAVAQRHGKPVILEVDAKRMHADGFEFFVTKNNVWLVDSVPPDYVLCPI
ncbi:MAG: RNA 2'-phosphotransferase [Planctomycetota bacterium]